jgi:hypothetical protein
MRHRTPLREISRQKTRFEASPLRGNSTTAGTCAVRNGADMFKLDFSSVMLARMLVKQSNSKRYSKPQLMSAE